MNARGVWLTGLVIAMTWGSALSEDPKRPIHVPEGALHFNGKWYQVILDKKTWQQAKQACDKAKGRLVCIHDADTQAFVVKLANGLKLFTGATDDEVEGRWMWADGKPMVFKSYRSGEPNNANRREHYLSLSTNGNWNDVRRDNKTIVGFICEWEAKPL